jgi:hypothetical protein
MLAEIEIPAQLLAAGRVSEDLAYRSSMLMRSDFENPTSWALMLNSGSLVFVRLTVPALRSSLCLLKPMVASSTRKTSNPSSFILRRLRDCSDSESDPLMASQFFHQLFQACIHRKLL